MKRKGLLGFLLAIIMLGVLATACGTVDEDEDTPVADSAAASTPGAGGVAGKGNTSGQVGTPVNLGDFAMTINNVKIEGGLLKANFTVENTAGGQISLLTTGYAALDKSGTALDSDIICSDLPTKVEAGKKVTGNECWKTDDTSTSGMKIRYNAGRTIGKTIIWTLP